MSVSESTVESYALRDPDVRLMMQVRDGDAAAFEELVLRYQNRLLMVLEHLVGSRDLAEDLTQEVFLRVYRARKRYTPGAKFSTWLFTIANNVASNARRTLARRREVHIAPTESGSMEPLAQIALAGSGQMPTRQVDKSEMREIVRLAIGTLNERQRMALLLSKFEEMSYADIAEVMQLSPQAVKSLLSRARGSLRDVLAPYLDHGQRPAARARHPGRIVVEQPTESAEHRPGRTHVRSGDEPLANRVANGGCDPAATGPVANGGEAAFQHVARVSGSAQRVELDALHLIQPPHVRLDGVIGEMCVAVDEARHQGTPVEIDLRYAGFTR